MFLKKRATSPLNYIDLPNSINIWDGMWQYVLQSAVLWV